MSLRDELAAVQVNKSGVPCTVCDWINTLDKDDAQAFTDALNDGSLPGTAILKAITNYGCTTVSIGSLRRHRRGDCTTTKVSG